MVDECANKREVMLFFETDNGDREMAGRRDVF